MNRLIIFCLICLSSTWASQAQVFDLTVAKDGSGDFTTIQAAIDSALKRNDQVRTTLFIKAGVYEEKLYIGSHSESKTNVLSLVGAHRDSVIIRWDDYNGKQIYYYDESSLKSSGTPQSATFTVNAPDFYMENITVVNSYTSKQAVALYNVGDRQTFKNCRLVGFQDTHYLKKGRRSFFYDCQIEGGTDFICAGGTAVFYRCKVKSIAGGQFITAPEDVPYTALLPSGKTLYYGFMFIDCDLISDGKLSNGSVYMGRPWQGTSGCLYLSCRLGAHIRPEGWSTWSGTTNHLSSFFGEYRSLNADGSTLADISRRVSWSYQLSDADVDAYLRLNTIYKAGSFKTATPFQPLPLVVAPQPVTQVTRNGKTLSWPPSTANTPNRGYLVFANGSCIGQTTATQFTLSIEPVDQPTYEVRVVGLHGNLSLPSGQTDTLTLESLNAALNEPITGLDTPFLPEGSSEDPSGQAVDPTGYFQQTTTALLFQAPTTCTLYNIQGQVVTTATETMQLPLSALQSGLYLMRATISPQGSYNSTIMHRP